MTRTRTRGRAVTTIPRDDSANDGGGAESLRNDMLDLYGPQKSGAQLENEFAAEEMEINALIAEAGSAAGGGSVVLRRKNPASRKFEWLAKYPGAEFLSVGGVAHIAAQHGGGEYELIIYGADNRIVKRPQVTIAASVLPKMTGEPSNDIGKLGAIMMEGFKALALQMQQAQRPPESREAFIRELMLMKELFGGGARQDNSLDTLSKVLPIVKGMLPRGEGETNLLDVMMRLTETFGPTIADAAKRLPAALPGVAGTGPLPGTLAPAPILNAEQIGANQMQLMLKAKLALLCSEAEADSDPGPYAEIIVTKVPPAMLAKIIHDPNWLDELAKIHAGVKLFPAWFEELRVAVLETMQPEEIPGAEIPGTDGGEPENMPS